jgi:hypothetical protein
VTSPFKLALAVVVLFSATAHADTWTQTAELVASDRAAIRVLEPEGYTFTVNGRTDTSPAVFALPNTDQYILVEATAPNGAHWQQKVEVRAYTQTVLRVRHVVDRPKDERPQSATFVGVLYNTTHLCRKETDRIAWRFDVTADGRTLTSNVLEPRSRADLSLPAGTYAVRRYTQRAGQWEFAATQSLTVTKDGWVYGIGCDK